MDLPYLHTIYMLCIQKTLSLLFIHLGKSFPVLIYLLATLVQ